MEPQLQLQLRDHQDNNNNLNNNNNNNKDAPHQPSSVHVAALWSPGKRKWYTGMLVSTLFAAAYYVRPIHMVIPILMAYYGFPNLWISYLFLSVFLLSVSIPPKPSRTLVGKLLSPILDYFDYDQIVENSPVHVRETMKDGKRYIFACQPHGVVPFCGIAWSVFHAQQQLQLFPTEPQTPTAVASLVLYTPILKHVLGIFSCVSASRASLKRTLRLQSSVRLYVGGTTEVFDCNAQVEVLHLTKRKGFIKLALQLGVDIVPVYMFGNTSVFSLPKDKYGVLVSLSRVLQMPVTYFWGVYGLPIPHNDKVR
jgi:hypothetical protein